MEPFEITTSNGSRVSGVANLVKATPASPPKLPLIVAIHGATMSAKYFDATPGTSAKAVSDALGIPFVSMDRPGYGQSSGLSAYPPEGSSWHQEEGRHLHQQILPAIWRTYGADSGASGVVLLPHSMAVPGVIVASALHAAEQESKYPLIGAVMSGWGTRPRLPSAAIKLMLETQTKTPEDRVRFDNQQLFETLMFGDESASLADIEVRKFSRDGKLQTDMSYGEAYDGNITWWDYWKVYASKVKIPLMYGMGEADGLWKGDIEAVEEFAKEFIASPRVERGMIPKAPHCLELSKWSRAWYVRCFGFAAECAQNSKVGFRRI